MLDFMRGYRKKNRKAVNKYSKKYMAGRRAYFRKMWKEGRIKYAAIPKSYRYWDE